MQIKQITIIAVSLFASGCFAGSGEGSGIQYGPSRKLATLKDRKIHESSGLACGRLNRDIFWTHNDSGDAPRIFAVGRDGTTVAIVTVGGAENIDWEDICSFSIGGKSYLLIADVGDNVKKRKFVTLYLIEEPKLKPRKTPQKLTVLPALKIDFTYADGPDDCESIAVDPTSKTVVIATKGKQQIYLLKLDIKTATTRPAKFSTTKLARQIQILTLKPAAKLDPLAPTGMDISPDGRRAIMVGYLCGYEYTRNPDESWAQAMMRKPRIIALPMRRQGESICFGCDGRSLYLTSEKIPTPLIEIPAKPPIKSPTKSRAKPSNPPTPLDNTAPNTQNMQKSAGKSSPATPRKH